MVDRRKKKPDISTSFEGFNFGHVLEGNKTNKTHHMQCVQSTKVVGIQDHSLLDTIFHSKTPISSKSQSATETDHASLAHVIYMTDDWISKVVAKPDSFSACSLNILTANT